MMKNKQAGNTLIFVLVILLLITIIGTWAIRGAITSLNIYNECTGSSFIGTKLGCCILSAGILCSSCS